MSFEKPSKFLRFFSSGEYKAVAMPSYRFKSFFLNVSERRLTNSDEPVPLTPKVFDTLVYLVERAGHLAEKEKIMEAVWPDAIVEEGNLARSIHTLRKVFGQADGGDVFIETVPTKGYRFVAPVEEVLDAVSIIQTGRDNEVGTDSYLESRSMFDRFRRRPVIFLGSAFVTVGLILLLLTSFGSYVSVDSLIARTPNGLAYREFQQGKLLVERRLQGADPNAALEHFERAVAADPDYADALAGEADAHMLIFFGNTRTHEGVIKARTAIDRAIEIDPSNAYARTINCRLLAAYEWHLEKAEAECSRAVQLDPGNAEARRELGLLLDSVGRTDEALESMRIAASLAATSFNKRLVGVMLYHARRYDEAIDQLTQVATTDPEEAEACKWLSWAYEQKGDEWNAFNALVEQMRRKGMDNGKIAEMQAIFYQGGWQAILSTRLNFQKGPLGVALIDAGDYAQLGDTEKALAILEDMYQRRAVMMVTIGREPRLDPIRNDPRFADLVKRVGIK